MEHRYLQAAGPKRWLSVSLTALLAPALTLGQEPSLEERVEALEERVPGVTPDEEASIKDRVEALEAQLAGEGSTAQASAKDDDPEPSDESGSDKSRNVARQASRAEQPQRQTKPRWPRIDVGGLVEVEGVAGEDFAGEGLSDLLLATVELGAEARINRAISANVLLLFEEDSDEDIEVDEATIDIEPPTRPYSLRAGRFYVPFGVFQTAFIDDTLPLALGETRETAIRAGVGTHGFDLGAWVFKGNTDDDNLGQFGVDASFSHQADGWALDTGVSLINSIADSGSLQEALPNTEDLDDEVLGWNPHARLEAGNWTLTGEYIAALEPFESDELAFDGSGAQPEAWQLEVGYEVPWGLMPVTTAVGWQGTDEALALGLPAQRFLAGVSVEPWQATSLSLQLARDEDYDRGNGGTGHDSETAKVQMAVSF